MMDTPDDFLGPVNLGNPREFTILELAERLIRLTGSRAKIVFRPLPQDDPVQRKPDIRLARETLAWQPKIPLEEGIEKTIAYFRSVIAGKGQNSHDA
jgi:UDP-glucuronate decarboxylase